VQAGVFVLAPFGTQGDFDRLVSGIVVRVTTQKPDIPRIKPLEALLHSAPVIRPAHLELAQWLAETTVEPLSNCVRLFAPPGQSVHSDIEYALIERDVELPKFSKVQAELIDLLRTRGPLRAGKSTPPSASGIGKNRSRVSSIKAGSFHARCCPRPARAASGLSW
jgi:primosomal protein N'